MRNKYKSQRVFLEEMSEKMEVLDKLLYNDDWDAHLFERCAQVYRIAHAWKGSAPMFGLEQIGEIAGRVEQLWSDIGEEGPESYLNDRERWLESYQLAVQESKPLYYELELEHALRLRELEQYGGEDGHVTSAASKNQRILIVDDDALLRSYIARHLELDGYETDEAGDVESAIVLLRQRQYHLITLDLLMQPTLGYELFDYVKGDPSLKWIPLIVISGNSEISHKVKSFRLGADDYVTKPFNMDELVARIERMLERTNEFEQLAFRDPLTGIYNRRFIDNQIDMELKRAQRYKSKLTIGFIDIDRFKHINDTYGHHNGDLVLQGLSHRLQSALRGTDFVGRYGGEEFIVLFPHTSAEQASSVIAQVLEKLHDQPIAKFDDQEFFITFSAGLCEYDAMSEAKDWIARADAAMYRAKQEGRNRIIVHSLCGPGSSEPKKRVLVAEDDELLRAILISMINDAGYEAVGAADGQEAAELAERYTFQLGLIDILMPNMDGFQLLERIRLAGKQPDMKNVVLSVKKNEDDIRRAELLGAVDYVVKPFSLTELLAKVNRLMK